MEGDKIDEEHNNRNLGRCVIIMYDPFVVFFLTCKHLNNGW